MSPAPKIPTAAAKQQHDGPKWFYRRHRGPPAPAAHERGIPAALTVGEATAAAKYAGDLAVAQRARSKFRLTAGGHLAACVYFLAHDYCEDECMILLELIQPCVELLRTVANEVANMAI